MRGICTITLVDNKKRFDVELCLCDTNQLIIRSLNGISNHWPVLDIFEAMGFDVLGHTGNVEGVCFVHKTLDLDMYVLFSNSVMCTIKSGKQMDIQHILLNESSVDIYGTEAKNQLSPRNNPERIWHFEPPRSLLRGIKLRLLKLRVRTKLLDTKKGSISRIII